MPQATDKLRKEWNGPSSDKAIKFLEDAGYKLNKKWMWVCPSGKKPTKKELRAILFLIQEWDYGGMLY